MKHKLPCLLFFVIASISCAVCFLLASLVAWKAGYFFAIAFFLSSILILEFYKKY